MPKPKQMQVRKKSTDFRLTLERKGIRSFIGYVIKVLYFLMTCQSAARNAVEHLVPEQEAGDISPGGRVKKGKGRGGKGGADFEALCSLLLSSGLQGQTNVLPTQFQPC